MNRHGGARAGAGRKPALFNHERALSLRKQGFTYEQIAGRLGVTKSAIEYFIRNKHPELGGRR